MAGSMVRSTLAGIKTQTRRLMNPQPKGELLSMGVGSKSGKHFATFSNGAHPCPFGTIGARLYVRETWRPVGPWECREDGATIQYHADSAYLRKTGWPEDFRVKAGDGRDKWKPSIHHPRWASRLTLEITDVRVERLQDISEEDAEAEGVTTKMAMEILEPLARRFKGAGGIYYLEHKTDRTTIDKDLCKPCAIRACKKNKSLDWRYDGDAERDSIYCHCEDCGKALELPSPTAYCCGIEFTEGMLSNGAPTSPHEAEIAHRAFEFAQYYQNDKDVNTCQHRAAFAALWDSLAEPGQRWTDNPWLWCLSFRVITEKGAQS